MSMTKEQLKAEIACLPCGGLFCDKHPVNTEGKPFSPACVEALVVAADILRLIEQYCEDNNIKQVVEGELPKWFRFKWTGLQPERAFTDDLEEISYEKVKPVRLVE